MKPQKNIQFGYLPIPHEMHVPTATKTDTRKTKQTIKISPWSTKALQPLLIFCSLGSAVQWGSYLWRQHRSRGRRAPPEVSCCLSSWPASHQWRLETGRWTGPERSWWRPMLEPGGGGGRGTLICNLLYSKLGKKLPPTQWSAMERSTKPVCQHKQTWRQSNIAVHTVNTAK